MLRYLANLLRPLTLAERAEREEYRQVVARTKALAKAQRKYRKAYENL